MNRSVLISERGGIKVAGVALVMVLLVLSALAILGTPFVISMTLQERSSFHFDGEVKVRLAAEAASRHAMARLSESTRAAESAREARDRGVFDALDDRRAATGGTRRLRKGRVRTGTRRNSVVGSNKKRGGTRRESGRSRREREREEEERRSPLRQSARGPLQKDYDDPSELEVTMPSTVVIPDDAPRVFSWDATSVDSQKRAPESLEVDFQDYRGITASAEIIDEQSKINVNTAPPNLIANLFAVSQLARELDERDRVVELDDARSFPTDSNSSNIDGAVVVVHPLTGRVEAITYQYRVGNSLEGIFRGAFFSTPYDGTFPKGSFVYDLRGWKIGYHRFRAGSINGFVARDLAEFSTVEAIREIANWQVVSLFLERLGGQRLTESFLRDNGVRMRDLEKSGLDPSLFQADRRYSKGIFKIRLEDARKTLRRLRIRRSLIDRLEGARGPRAVVALAARLDGLDRRAAKKEAEGVEKMLKRLRNKPPQFDRKYLKNCLANLAEVQRSAGVETVRPEDLEQLREAITVHSWVPARWTDSQIVPDAVVPGDQTERDYRLEIPGPHGGGGIVRLRHRKSSDIVEFNQTIQRGKNVPRNSFRMVFPVFGSFRSRDARVDFLERHPVNINTASERVLVAVFTGIQDARTFKRVEDKSPGLVTPSEARLLTTFVMGQRPYSGPRDFRNRLFLATHREIIDDEDVEPVYINSIQPNHYRLRISTTGFCYATGDVYTVRGRGILRSLAGGEVTSHSFRQIVEVSPPRSQQWTLFGQSDFSSQIYVRNPYSDERYSPENLRRYSITLPGTQSHLVRSTPILTKLQQSRVFESDEKRRSHRFFAVPGGELGGLRLESPETLNFSPEPQVAANVAKLPTDTEHFRDERDEMGNRSGGQPFRVSTVIRPQSDDGSPLFLTNTIGSSYEAWVRFRTFPEPVEEGMFYVMDSGVERRRNRLSVLYDTATNEWVARIYDGTAPDPDFSSLSSTSEVHQWVELRHNRPMDLHTWYHVRLAWDGAYAGGVQLFIDGFPAEGSNLRGELGSNITINQEQLSFSSLVNDWTEKFPGRGVARIGQELFDFENQQLGQWPGGQTGQYPSDFARYTDQFQSSREAAMQPLRECCIPAGTDSQNASQQSQVPVARRGAKDLTTSDQNNGNRRGTVRADHQSGASVTLHGYSLGVVRKLVQRDPTNGVIRNSIATGDEVVLGEGGLVLADDLLPFNLPEYFVLDRTVGVSQLEVTRRVEVVNFADEEPFADRIRELEFVNGAVRRRGGGEGLTWAHDSAKAAEKPGFLTPVFYCYLRPRDLFRPENAGIFSPAAMQAAQQVQAAAGLDIPMELYSRFMGTSETLISVDRFFQSKGVAGIEFSNGSKTAMRYLKTPVSGINPASAPMCRLLILNLSTLQFMSIECRQLTNNELPLMAYVLSDPVTDMLRTSTMYPSGAPPNGTFMHARRLSPNSILASGPVEDRYPKTGIIELRGSPPPWHMSSSGVTVTPRMDRNLDVLQVDRYFDFHPDDVVEWIRYYDVDGDMFVADPRVFMGNRPWAFRDYPRAWSQFDDDEHCRGESGLGTSRRRRDPCPDEVENQLWHDQGTPIRQVVELKGGGAGYGDYVTISTDDPRISESTAWRVYNVQEFNDGRFFASLIHPDGERRVFENTYTAEMRPRLEKFPSGFPPRVGSPEMVFFGDSVVGTGARQTPTAYTVEEEVASGYVVDEVRGTWGARRFRNPRFVVVPLNNGRVQTDSHSSNYRTLSGVIPEGREINQGSPFEILVVSVGDEFEDFLINQKEGVLRINEELFFFENPNAGDGGSGAPTGNGSLRSFTLKGVGNVSQRRRALDPSLRMRSWDFKADVDGEFEVPGFFRIDMILEGYEVVYFERKSGGDFFDCLRGQFQTTVFTTVNLPANSSSNSIGAVRNAAVRLRLVGRGLLGSPRQTHNVGDSISRVNYLPITQVTGPMTDTGLPVTETNGFPGSGYLLLDPARGTRDYEIVAYSGRDGEGLFQRPRGEDGRGILRQRFGTAEFGISSGMFAYALPYRFFDRYEPLAESEDIAHFQKSFRAPGAFFKSISWRERASPSGRERLCDVIVAARFDGVPEWNVKPTNKPGGLFVFDARDIGHSEAPIFPLEVAADQIEVRVYFRYQEGAFRFIDQTQMSDDWKETPVLDALTVEYEKAGRVLRHEETRF